MTALEYMEKQLIKNQQNYDIEEKRGAPEEMLNNIDKKIRYYQAAMDALNMVDRVGYWYVSEYEYLDCSVCGESMYTGCQSSREANLLKDHWKKFCPNCGARMDGERKEI